MTRGEIIQKTAEEIVELQQLGMLTVEMAELIISSAMLDAENMAVEKQLEVLGRVLREKEEDHADQV